MNLSRMSGDTMRTAGSIPAMGSTKNPHRVFSRMSAFILVGIPCYRMLVPVFNQQK